MYVNLDVGGKVNIVLLNIMVINIVLLGVVGVVGVMSDVVKVIVCLLFNSMVVVVVLGMEDDGLGISIVLCFGLEECV